MFFALAADRWDAEFYAKLNDDVYVNIGQYHNIWYNLQYFLTSASTMCINVKLKESYT